MASEAAGFERSRKAARVKSEWQNWFESLQTSDNFEQWMADLPHCLKHVPINHLAIPGTHDSMSCGISRSSGISPDSATVVKALGKIFGPVIKPVIFKWCVTQHRGMKEQLIAGIRYFDLRIAVHKRTGTLQFVHGMYAQEILHPFSDIQKFLCNHKHEVVVLDLQHFYDFSAPHHVVLQNFLFNYFGPIMCPLPKDGDVSKYNLHWLNEHGYQVIVIYRSPAGHGKERLWPSDYWPTPWPKTTSVQNLILFLNKGLSQRHMNAGYVTQCVLTPNTWFVVQHPLSNLLSRCAAPCNYAMVSWLEKQHPGPRGVNVVITDYFDFDAAKFPFVKTIVLLNRKLILQKCDCHNDKVELESVNIDSQSYM